MLSNAILRTANTAQDFAGYMTMKAPKQEGYMEPFKIKRSARTDPSYLHSRNFKLKLGKHHDRS